MRRRTLLLSLFVTWGLLAAAPAAAQDPGDRLCDPGNEDCRAILINYIRNEKIGIDVAFWFMEDARYTTELINRYKAGVPVRVLMDPRANATYDLNDDRLNELQAAGIPMRKRLTSYILHWKMMLFRGQGVVEFSGANYSADAWRPSPGTPSYTNYTDEAIYFTSDAAIFDSFATKFDDHWVNTSEWANYANVVEPLVRTHPISPKDPSLNFPPAENYRTRSIAAYKTEKRQIDAIMYRITDQQHTDNILASVARGIPVRLITEPAQYRLVSRMWHSWNVDRLYMGGVQIKHRAHAGLNHQKSVILYDQDGVTPGDQSMVIFGSSNWTSPSAAGQVEHNIFTKKPAIVSWFVDQFERKWNNSAGVTENTPFVPLPPDAPKSPIPANLATGVDPATTLRWNGGPWAHLYELQIATDQAFTNIVFSSSHTTDLNLREKPDKTETSAFPKTGAGYALPSGVLLPGTTYFWRVTGRTMALVPKVGPIWSFTTAGTAAPPPVTGSAEIVLYAADASVTSGWEVVSDSTAAGGSRLANPNLSAAKITAALAAPAKYFELTFNAEAGKGYRLWVRGKAESNYWANDSVFIQFSGSVTSGGSPVWRIGTTSATEMNLEDCSGCGVSGWGWQDNGYGTNVLGPLVYFDATGPQTMRVQVREDGLSIDQIVLSDVTFVSTAPGAKKNDTTILSKTP